MSAPSRLRRYTIKIDVLETAESDAFEAVMIELARRINADRLSCNHYEVHVDHLRHTRRRDLMPAVREHARAVKRGTL